MLTRLLRIHLRPYKRDLLLLVVLQSVQVAAALSLPALNADIIDQGVLPGDTAYIRSRGALDAAASRSSRSCSRSAAVRVGARVAMGFGRDLRAALFHQVTDFSAREVGTFGAPSLITRITNDVQQVQMLVVMACTMAIAAPITMVVGVIMALRQDVGLSIVLLVAMPLAGRRARDDRQPDGADVPPDAGATSTTSTASCGSRSPASAWCGPSSASRRRPSASRWPTPTSPPPRCAAAG